MIDRILISILSFAFGFAIVHAQTVTASGITSLPRSAIGSLPTCNAAAEGTLFGVTDALIPAALATVAAGGAVHVSVYCNGTNWIVL